MAPPALPIHAGPEQLITVKVLYNYSNRRFKLPLNDLKAEVFPEKLRTLLGIPADVNVIFERYSDSANSYIRLDCNNAPVYKQLYRAAKAKSKLRIKASTDDPSASASAEPTAAQPDNQVPPRHNYLETVYCSPIPVAHPETFPTSVETAPATTSSASHARLTLPGGQPRYRDFEMEQDSKLRFPVISHNSPNGMFCIDCNNCSRSIANDHYHCSICEDGDYDLCPQCVDAGASCRGDGHWLIKRVVSNGVVTNSTTETIPPRRPVALQESKTESASVPPMPEAVPEPVPEMAATAVPSAVDLSNFGMPGVEKPMCNGCCLDTDEHNLVRCLDCEDYDLCLRCLMRNVHGHHPAHQFSIGSNINSNMKNLLLSRCQPGRQFKHAAICDGCEKRIVGVRHKCLSCPDWDFCPDCVVHAGQNHPGHRFVPIYEHIGDQPREFAMHYGIFCDGPLCKNKPAQSYVTGIRYKCAVCDDVDFCANCEALPTNDHNRTHPLIKFKTPVRAVNVRTVNDDGHNGLIALGDNARSRSEATLATPLTSDQKQPVMGQVPVEVDASKPEKNESTAVMQSSSTQAPAAKEDPFANFNAYFIRDAIPDGTQLPPNTAFRQTWTLHNPGPSAWPVGSDVRFVGGDTMFNVDSNHPSSVDSIRAAMESNKLTAPVEVGQSADFTVTLRTPQREGTAISYWRLKLPNGVAIGHRLWCDVQVRGYASTASSEAEPPATEAMESKAPESSAPDNTENTSSGMIFPRLEKESPESSTHEAVAPIQQAPTLSNASEGDVVEDTSSLTLDEASTDAGFLTDEEYDVLDASDQEYLEAKQSVH